MWMYLCLRAGLWSFLESNVANIFRRGNEYGGYGWDRTTDLGIMSAAL
jgi:hypothetical protein